MKTFKEFICEGVEDDLRNESTDFAWFRVLDRVGETIQAIPFALSMKSTVGNVYRFKKSHADYWWILPASESGFKHTLHYHQSWLEPV